jgi:hypothetical protein
VAPLALLSLAALPSTVFVWVTRITYAKDGPVIIIHIMISPWIANDD